MRDAGCKGGVEDVHVERDVDRAPGLHLLERSLPTDFEDFDAEARGLFFLVLVHRTDADLDKALSKLFFHDASKRRGVRMAVALEVIVEIGVSVEMNDGQVFEVAAEGAHDGISDGMIATETDGTLAFR